MDEIVLHSVANLLTYLITTKLDHLDPALFGSFIYELLNSLF